LKETGESGGNILPGDLLKDCFLEAGFEGEVEPGLDGLELAFLNNNFPMFGILIPFGELILSVEGVELFFSTRKSLNNLDKS
jgi:hypothetical protein